jgi:hypothetical protein
MIDDLPPGSDFGPSDSGAVIVLDGIGPSVFDLVHLDLYAEEVSIA